MGGRRGGLGCGNAGAGCIALLRRLPRLEGGDRLGGGVGAVIASGVGVDATGAQALQLDDPFLVELFFACGHEGRIQGGKGQGPREPVHSA